LNFSFPFLNQKYLFLFYFFFRKYVFGTFGVYGNEGDFEIRGIWMWRGTEIPAHLKENLPNFEYHDWIKLDHTNAEHKKLIEE
jgi:elongation factor 1-gamma